MNITQQNIVQLKVPLQQLLPGQRVIRINGSKWLPVGVGGNYLPGLPEYEFYKCASVQSGSSAGGTWTGYKAVWNNGWSFSTQLTTDLTYTASTPQVDGIYLKDATGKVSYMWYGTVSDSGSATVVGQTLRGIFTGADAEESQIFNFVMDDTTATGNSRTWTDATAGYTLKFDPQFTSPGAWAIRTTSNALFASALGQKDNPWQDTSWTPYQWGVISGVSWTVSGL